MPSILTSLYNGEIVPCEQLEIEDPAYEQAAQRIDELLDYFKTNLDADLYAKIEALENHLRNMGNLQAEAAFAKGFRLAQAILQEAE